MTDFEKMNMASRIMSGIEFVGDQNRCNEIASIYRYLGLNSNLVASNTLASDGCYKFNMYKQNEGIYARKADANPSQNVRMKLPCYGIAVEGENPSEFLYYLDGIESSLKRKFDAVNREIADNRRHINYGRENIGKRISAVNDFFGMGNKDVSPQEFKAYITGLSIRNHRLKKKAKSLFRKYTLVRRLKDFIIVQCVGVDGFDHFYREFMKVCTKHRINN
jgi:hypothetical protein